MYYLSNTQILLIFQQFFYGLVSDESFVLFKLSLAILNSSIIKEALSPASWDNLLAIAFMIVAIPVSTVTIILNITSMSSAIEKEIIAELSRNRNNGEIKPTLVNYVKENNFFANDRVHFLVIDAIPNNHYLNRYLTNDQFFRTVPDECGELRSYFSLTPILSNAFCTEPFLQQLRGRVPKPDQPWKGKEYAVETKQDVEKISPDLVGDKQRSTGTQTNDIEAELQISRVSNGTRQLIRTTTLADFCLFQGTSESELDKARIGSNRSRKFSRQQHRSLRSLLFEMLRETLQAKFQRKSLGNSKQF